VSALAASLTPLLPPIAVPLNGTQASYNAVAARMKELNPDVVVAGSRVGSCVMFLKACKDINWLPKALLTTLCANDPNLVPALTASGLTLDDARYIIDSAVWDPRLRGPEFEDPNNYFFPPSGVTSAQQFYNAYVNFTSGTYLDITSAPLSMANAYALEEAISKAQSIDAMAVYNMFPTILMNSFFGKIGFNGFGQNDAKSVANIQISKTGTIDILSPLSASTASIVFPMPNWDERIWIKQPFGYAGEQAIAVLAGLAVIFSIAMGVLTFFYRKRKAIIASSPLFLGIMLIGSVLIYGGIFTWTLTSTDQLCMAHWWLLGLGFAIMFGALLVKVWRISRIFNDKDLSVIRISNLELLSVVGIVVLIEVILLVVWNAAGPSKALRYSLDPLRPKYDYLNCTTTSAGTVILIIAAVYKGLIIIAGVWLSVRTWKIKYSIYNESRSIAFSMYNLFFFLVLAIIVQLVINAPTQRKAQFVVRSVMVLLGAFLPIAVIFLPKFLSAVHLNSENVGTHSSKSKKSGGTNSTALNSIEDGSATDSKADDMSDSKLIERLKLQNERLKNEVKKLRAEVTKHRDTK